MFVNPHRNPFIHGFMVHNVVYATIAHVMFHKAVDLHIIKGVQLGCFLRAGIFFPRVSNLQI
jgi:hypothetical protein